MAIKLNEANGGKLLEVTVSGKLHHEDYAQLVPTFERSVAAHGKIRMLFEMEDFHGWDLGALWDDIKFDVKHFGDLERIAMVGEREWERGMSVFCRPFTSAKVHYFDRADIGKAREWLAGDGEGSDEGRRTNQGSE